MYVNWFKVIEDYRISVTRHQMDTCDGIASKYRDGYAIIIREDLPDYKYFETLQHELIHILLGHLDEYAHLSAAQKESEVEYVLSLDDYEPLRKYRVSCY